MIRVDNRRFTIRLDPGQPGMFVSDPDGPVARDVERRGIRMKLEARRRVRVRSASLLSTIRTNMRYTPRSVSVEVLAGGGRVRYALVEETGSRAHEITPSRRKALRFVVAGRVVFRQRV